MRVIDRTTATALVMLAVVFSFSCEDSKMRAAKKPAGPSEVLPEDALRRLSQRNVYFGHQSVGYNVVGGIVDLLKAVPHQALNIVETRELAAAKSPFFAHSAIGRNGEPVSKLDDFADVLRRNAPARIDIALLKFCFVDFSEETDVQNLFRRYADTFAGLKKSFPGTTFVHVTVPLTGNPNGLKWTMRNVVKRLIGRHVRTYKDNRRINEFNELLRASYLGKEPVFDLAALESTHADGTRVMDQDAGLSVYSLAPEYTFDGGHLNEMGRRIVALELLRCLAALPERAPLN